LPKRRYSYTPRRGGSRSPRSARKRSRADASAPSIHLVPTAVIVCSLLVAIWLIFLQGTDGSSFTNDDSSDAVLTSSNAPEQPDAAVAAAPADGAPAAAAPAATPAPTPFVPGDAPPPGITGGAAAVIEEPCGKLLYGLNEDTQLPPASLTKIATAIVAAENKPMNEPADVLVDGGALSIETGATVMGLKPGQQMSMADLVNGLMLRSGNDAALTIAHAVAGSEAKFVEMMNGKVASLGLHNTHFVNSHGLDASNHYTSAHDIALLGHELLRDPQLASIVQTQAYSPNWDGGQITNINLLLSNYPGAIGVKTGYTDLAGMTIVGGADRDGRRILVSVLQSSDIYVDAMSLLDWAFANTSPACDSPPAQAAAINP
jgi:D-alanyl-D-alanine carboxypeptidase